MSETMSERHPETLRRRRGHAFYPPRAIMDKVPPMYATEATPTPDKTIYAHYFAPSMDFYVAELDLEAGDAFGYARHVGHDGEWTCFSLPDLERHESAPPHVGYTVIVERDMDWTPRPASTLADERTTISTP